MLCAPSKPVSFPQLIAKGINTLKARIKNRADFPIQSYFTFKQYIASSLRMSQAQNLKIFFFLHYKTLSFSCQTYSIILGSVKPSDTQQIYNLILS